MHMSLGFVCFAALTIVVDQWTRQYPLMSDFMSLCVIAVCDPSCCLDFYHQDNLWNFYVSLTLIRILKTTQCFIYKTVQERLPGRDPESEPIGCQRWILGFRRIPAQFTTWNRYLFKLTTHTTWSAHWDSSPVGYKVLLVCILFLSVTLLVSFYCFYLPTSIHC